MRLYSVFSVIISTVSSGLNVVVSPQLDFMKYAIKVTSETICTCLDWSWCRTPGHCVRRGSLTHWPSSHPWSSLARRRTLCQSDSSLGREENTQVMLRKVTSTSSDVVRHSSAVTFARCTCRRLDLAQLLRRDAPHPHCRVGEASCNQAGVVCEVHRCQTLQENK